MKRIVFEMPDGSILVREPVLKGRRPGEKEMEWYDREAAKGADTKLAGATRLADATDFPSRYFRSCWRNDGRGAAHVDMPLARGQRMVEIRAQRNIRLDDSDKEWARLSEGGTPEQQAAHSAYRQALRDLPQSIDLELLDTAEKLEAFQPAWPDQP